MRVTRPQDAATAVARLLERGVRMGALGPRTIRAVTRVRTAAREIFRA